VIGVERCWGASAPLIGGLDGQRGAWRSKGFLDPGREAKHA